MFDRLYLSELQDESQGLIEITDEDLNDKVKNEDLPDELGILPVRNTVLFPGVVLPITVGREKSIKLVNKANRGNKIIGVVAQKNSATENPGYEDISRIGTVAKIIKILLQPDGSTTIIIQGKTRFKINEIVTEDPFMIARINVLKNVFPPGKNKEGKALMESLKDSAGKILRLNPEIPQEAQMALDNIHDLSFLTHFLASNLNADVKKKQLLLETDDGFKRATLLLEYMLREVQLLELKYDIQKKAHIDIDQQQRDYFLRQQIKVMQSELGNEGHEKEVEELRKKGESKKWPDEVKERFEKELEKIMRISPQAPEYPVSMGYVELLLELPWNEFTKDNFNLKRAGKILDKDHFGMEKVKDRIIEYLAVLKLKNDMKGPILCLYGPPGVGKTSLGRSIAKSLSRQYVRMSLGGVHDEAEVRGHRKTYIGALPGKIIQNLKKAKASNPVFVLDEIDKVNSDFRGDPASALLEVLDPEQNFEFKDNYLELDYDLSKILFIATANSLDTIHPALRDRMEIIELSGYTLEEKVEIAKRHLIPKQKREHGLKTTDVKFQQSGIVKIIEGYTRESGVRNLERKIGAVIRRTAKSMAMEQEFAKTITNKEVVDILGTERFDKELYQGNDVAGVVTGLAWTQVGGEILFIESSLSRGKGKLTLSGQLGDVMKESAMAALSYIKATADRYDIDHRVFEYYDLHVHVPAGAVPKDGPSAGITMLTSLVSIYTQRKVKSKLAMTGEITLRGKVLPVGGIKEKILAARRAGIKEIILSEKNRRDIEDIDEKYIKNILIHYVSDVGAVLEIALLNEKIKHPVPFKFPEEKT